MRVVLTTTSKPRADMIEARLTSASIPASVVARANGLNGAYTSYDVMLMRSTDEPRARVLIEQTLAQWQAHTEDEVPFDPPDLGMLDPRLAPDCPGCAATLPMDASLTRCPACAHEVDVAAILVLLYGPELLESELGDPDHPEHADHPGTHFAPAAPRTTSGHAERGHPETGSIARVCPACGGPLESPRTGLFGPGGSSRCLACRRRF